MNMLQHIPKSFPVLVSLNPQVPIAPEFILERFNYSHLIANTAARNAQSKLPLIQGNRGTYFAGAYWGNGFHEDGVVSAIKAVQALNPELDITL
jgi:predicted NAD/FAD-binding protein